MTAALTAAPPSQAARRAPAELIQGVDAAHPPPAGTLRTLSLNLAHGRGERAHQALLSAPEIRGNLSRIADLLARERPDVVAVQEADAPSLWSGRFDHVAFLAAEARYPFAARGLHVDALGIRYGTGLLARARLSGAESGTFAPSPPTPAKGYTLATLPLGGLAVDVVSVHLDFARGSARRSQLGELERDLAGRGRPLVVMGDFNGGWSDAAAPLSAFAGRLGLHAFEPERGGAATFPRGNARIDWIFASAELRFAEHRVLPDAVSDHYAVVADLELAP